MIDPAVPKLPIETLRDRQTTSGGMIYASSASAQNASMLIQTRSKLVFLGDSITDADRVKPEPSEGLFDPMGRGYVTMVDSLLGTVYPERAIRVINTGIGGSKIRDLELRWRGDVVELRPDWISIMIGTNDVWRQFDSPKRQEASVPPEEFESTYAKLLEKTRKNLKGLVLMTPFYIEPNKTDAMRARMDQYGAIVKKLAGQFDATFVDTQAAFDKVLPHYYPGELSWDRVHPNQTGHMILAKAFLDGVQFEWNRA
jgi:lysophospholipase L1-like esterase